MKSVLQAYHINSKENRILKVFDSHIEAPNWTMDGKSLIYNTYGKIVQFDLQNGESTDINTGTVTRSNNDHVLSFDGAKIAISSSSEGHHSRIYTLPLSGGEPTLITPLSPSYLHGWSPDGKTLAYCADRNGNYDVYTIPVTGGEETRLTTAEGLDDGPEYSPDGKHIWFNSVRSGLMQLWRMNTDGSEQMQMTFDHYNSWFGHISPDGKNVVFVSYLVDQVQPGDHPANKDIKIRMMSTNGGEISTLLEVFGGQGTMNVNSWSPDSQEFAYVTYDLSE